ncbi:hypothetical protein EVAR_54593_1 [Eumeta japonica]|uniref:Uncharacterized protein n=1 Tax=Eumeta variegata TaxID=151549 RepID=A0A4C1YP04_EUMVA|nr:hypothetical protein EVAR_54593_1 [Eumeta japonica]
MLSSAKSTKFPIFIDAVLIRHFSSLYFRYILSVSSSPEMVPQSFETLIQIFKEGDGSAVRGLPERKCPEGKEKKSLALDDKGHNRRLSIMVSLEQID